MKRSKSILYVDQRLDQIVDQRLDQKEHFSRVPDSVLEDAELEPSARVVYAFLAGRTRGDGVATVGTRLIAERLGLSRTTVISGLAALEARCHLKAAQGGKSRGRYTLSSPIFRRAWREDSAGETIELYRGEAGEIQKRIVRSRAG